MYLLNNRNEPVFQQNSVNINIEYIGRAHLFSCSILSHPLIRINFNETQWTFAIFPLTFFKSHSRSRTISSLLKKWLRPFFPAFGALRGMTALSLKSAIPIATCINLVLRHAIAVVSPHICWQKGDQFRINSGAKVMALMWIMSHFKFLLSR